MYKEFPQLPYIVSSIFLFLSALLIYLIRWEFKGDRPSLQIYFQKIKKGVLLSFTNKHIFGLIIIGSTLFFVGSLYANNMHQPLQITLGIPIAFLGAIAAIFSGCKAPISIYTYKILQKLVQTSHYP
ncbi:hypothetical protein HY947_04320 [Candidatus Gottesmanbacteria bacterium]|nr:hypothetical protein [Candidatus Gottesmanbacteria bacterium]